MYVWWWGKVLVYMESTLCGLLKSPSLHACFFQLWWYWQFREGGTWQKNYGDKVNFKTLEKHRGH